jgi:hypothetical protein
MSLINHMMLLNRLKLFDINDIKLMHESFGIYQKDLKQIINSFNLSERVVLRLNILTRQNIDGMIQTFFRRKGAKIE